MSDPTPSEGAAVAPQPPPQVVPSPPGRPGKAPPKVYAPVSIPTPEALAQEEVVNSCVTRSVMAGVMGGLLGSVFGVFMGATDTQAAATATTAVAGTPATLTWRDTARASARSAARKSWSYAKGFSTMGVLFSGSECAIEKARAKHDSGNSAAAGCFTGGVLARGAGPQGMAVGCATFAAFSVLMDTILDTH